MRLGTRHGTTVWYVRVGKGPRIRLRAPFGSMEFRAEYHAAISGKLRPGKGAPAIGTLAWLVDRYRETNDWNQLSAATRRQRENILAHVLATAGTVPIAQITRAAIVDGRERRAKTPSQARHFLDAMRGLFRWALEAGLVRADLLSVSRIRSPSEGMDSFPGPRSTLPLTSAAGRLGRRSGFGSTCCSTPD